MSEPHLTIGMACYDDFDGVYFTVQSLRLYHDEVIDRIEILVVDNHPESEQGKAVEAFVQSLGDHARYVANPGSTGTSASRDLVFRLARGTAVLCLDCHVLLPPGVVKRLLDFYEHRPDCQDLLQGPLLNDTFEVQATHMEEVWRDGMLGTWAVDARGLGAEADPFEIRMHGCGLMSCRKDAWVGFNPGFRGFGGEEGYLQQKFRLCGKKALCVPFLRWLHRFARPAGVPYPLSWEDRVYNYLLGRIELGLDYGDVLDHFAPLMYRASLDAILRELNLPDLLTFWFPLAAA